MSVKHYHSITGSSSLLCQAPYLPVAACIWVTGQDHSHTLANSTVLCHTHGRVGGDVELGAVIVLVQDRDGHLWTWHRAQAGPGQELASCPPGIKSQT